MPGTVGLTVVACGEDLAWFDTGCIEIVAFLVEVVSQAEGVNQAVACPAEGVNQAAAYQAEGVNQAEEVNQVAAYQAEEVNQAAENLAEGVSQTAAYHVVVECQAVVAFLAVSTQAFVQDVAGQVVVVNLVDVAPVDLAVGDHLVKVDLAEVACQIVRAY